MDTINKKFVDLFEELKQNPDNEETLESIRKYFLSCLGSQEFVDSFNYYIENCEKLHFTLAMAFGYAVETWGTFVSDLKAAYNLCEKSRLLYETLPNYKHQFGYLSLLNSYLIYYNSVGNLDMSVKTLSEALALSKSSKTISYYISFSNNSVHLLNNLGLYNLSLKNLEELDKVYLSYVAEINQIIIKHLYCEQLIICGKLAKAKREAKILFEMNESNKKFNQIIFDRLYFEIAFAEKNNDDIEKYYKLLSENAKTIPVGNQDINYLYFEFATYFAYKQDYVKAKEYIELCIKNMAFMQGYQKRIYLLTIDIYDHLGLYKEETLIYKELEEVSSKSKEVLINLEASFSINPKETFNELSYRELYTAINKVANFGKEVLNASSYIEVDKSVEFLSNEIYKMNSFYLMIVSKNDKTAHLVHHGKLKLISFNEGLIQKSFVSANESFKFPAEMLSDALLKIICSDKKHFTFYCYPIRSNGTLVALFIYKHSDVNNGKLEGELSYVSLIKDYVKTSIDNIYKFNNIVDISLRDDLTKLYNRYGNRREINNQLNKYQNKYYVIMLDIDDFKSINDTYGHPAGDKVLIAIADILKIVFGDSNVARVGGEEFTALVLGSKEMMLDRVNQFFYAVDTTKIQFNLEEISVTISAGISSGLNAGEYIEAIERADKMLYVSKTTGKDKFTFDEEYLNK